ncbi:MAG: glycosyl hydrolase [Promethearchaeota archaeon]
MTFNLNDIKQEEFIKPPKSARPMVRWWWTGLDIEREELIREVQELDDAGFLGAEIQVFMSGFPKNLEKIDRAKAKLAHRFMQPYYYSCIKTVLEESSKRDMVIDLTIGSSWPIGGTHISKDESLKTLLIGEVTIEGPFHYSGPLPKFIDPPNLSNHKISNYKSETKLEAVIAVKPIGEPGRISYNNIQTVYIDKNSIIDLTETVKKQGNLDFDVPIGIWQVLVFYNLPSGANPNFDCRSSPEKRSLVLDHLSSKPIKKHLDLHLGEGKKYFKNHFGKTFRAIFTDSLELSSNWLWTEDFLKQFNKRRGYDLRKFLPVCFVPNRDYNYLLMTLGRDVPVYDFEDGSGERIRYDLDITISELFTEEFVQAITDWANNEKIKNRIQAYGIRADLLKAYGIAHIPETEQLYSGGIIDFLKLAGSSSIIYEKPIVTAEFAVWNQRDYLTTPLKLKVAADRLFVSGINQIIFHGFPYQNSTFSYPGYCGFSTPYLPKILNFSSNFSRINPFWEFFPLINQYISRCQLILQHGKTISNVAIFYPIFNYCNSVLKKEELVGGYLDEDDTPISRDQIGAHLKEWERLDKDDKWTLFLLSLTDILTSNGYYYTHVNEEVILRSTNKGKKLVIGSTYFETLIILNLEKISLKFALKLKKIASSGTKIIFVKKLPSKQNGFLDYEENDQKIDKIINDLIKSEKAYFLKDINEVPAFLERTLNVKPNLKYEEQQSTIYYIHKKTKGSDYYFLRHCTNKPKTVSIIFPEGNKMPFILNPWTGEMKLAAQYNKLKDTIKMDLYFEAYGSIIIEFKKSRKEIHALESPIKMERINNKILGCIDSSGEFLIKLSNKTERIINSQNELFTSIHIENWHLKTELRDYQGNIEPIEIDLEELNDWRDISKLKYCSSRAFYTSKFNLNDNYTSEDLQLILSIGRVHDVALVKVNGNALKPLLVYPYEIDISNYVYIGENTIEIEIIPTIRNRLIGYAKTGGRDWRNHRKKELAPSGLLGPVKIKPIKKIEINEQ